MSGAEPHDPAEQARRAYLDWLRAHPAETAAHMARLSAEVRALAYQCPQSPVFLSSQACRALETQTAQLLQLLHRLPGLLFGGAVDRQLGAERCSHRWRPWLRAFIAAQPPARVARPDTVWRDGQLQLIEQNITSAAGGQAVSEHLRRYFADHPALRALGTRLRLHMRSPIEPLVELLGEIPAGSRVAFLDAIDLDTHQPWDNEGLDLVELLQARGVPIDWVAPRNLQVRDDGVFHRGARVSVLLRGFLEHRIDARFDELLPLLQATARGLVRMVEPPGSGILFDKRLLAHLHRPELQALLSDAENALVQRCVPWSALVQDGEVEHAGQRRSLPALLRSEQADWVLKKGVGFGAFEVQIGRQLSEQAWAAACAQALEEGDWIVQRWVEPPRLELPFVVDGALVFAELPVLVCPLMVDGVLASAICRTGVPGGSLAIGGFKQSGMTVVVEVSAADPR